MRRVFALGTALLVTFGATGAAQAAPMTMECIVKGASGGWISEKTYFEYDPDRKTARVMDGVVMHFEGAPKAAEISENSDKKLVMNWQVNTRVSNQTTKMRYRLAFFKGKNRASIQAHPHGFANNFTARGNCKAVDGRIPSS